MDGTSGVRNFGGVYSEEYLTKLLGTAAADLFDKMRRSDAQVNMLLNLTQNPIIRAKWFVESVDDSKEEMLIAKFCNFVLMENMGDERLGTYKTWPDYIREAISMITFGFSVHEIAYKVVMDSKEWGNYIGIRNLGYRSPRTIQEWHLLRGGGLDYILQQAEGDFGQTVNIPGAHLIVNTVNKEGDNFEGIAALRPIYGNWFRKQFYLKTQAIGLEKAATGAPYGIVSADIETRKDATEQKAAFLKLLEQFSTYERKAMIVTDGFEIKEFKVRHDAEKVNAAIVYEDIQMSKSFFANFMELGMSKGGGGSFALSNDLSSVFLKGIEAYGAIIAENVNRRIIRTIVKAKFGAREVYPKMKVSGINDKAGKELAEVAQILVGDGLIRRGPRLEAFLLRSFDFPEAEDGDTFVEDVEQENDDVDLHENCNHERILYADPKTPPGLITKDSAELEDAMKEFLTDKSQDMINSISTIITRDGMGAATDSRVRGTAMKGQRAYKELLIEHLASTATSAIQQVKKELGSVAQGIKLNEELDALPIKSRRKILNEIDLIIKDHYSNSEKAVLFSYFGGVENTDSIQQIVQDMESARDTYVDGASIRAGANIFVADTVNSARNDVFIDPEVSDGIESFIFRNPDPKSDICMNLNGRVFSKEEYATTPFLPPLHHNCKSYIQAQTTGRKDNQSVDAIGLTPTGTPDQVEAILKSKTI
ncbi:MAG: phage portal protein family protein [Candidatus Anammoxibacter sp.]